MHPRRVRLAGLLLVLSVVAGCASPAASPTPTPGPSGEPMAVAELQVLLIDRLGAPWFCDPDEYPVGRDEAAMALERWGDLLADPGTLDVVARRAGQNPGPAGYTDAQKLAIYREWKQVRAVTLSPIGNDRFRFDLLVRPAAGAVEGRRIAGIVDARGGIEIEQQAAAGEPSCPICLDGSVLIETPAGPVRIDELREGDPVWTFDSDGRRVEGVVLAVRSVAAPANHRLVRLVLDDGRELLASPGHPLADGRRVGALRPGDRVDGARVVHAERVPAGERTWDLLASGETGGYLAAGIGLRSTLKP